MKTVHRIIDVTGVEFNSELKDYIEKLRKNQKFGCKLNAYADEDEIEGITV